MLVSIASISIVQSIKTDAANGVALFPMSDLTKMFDDQKKQLKIQRSTHATRLKERILKAFKGNLRESGADTGPKTLIFRDGLYTLVREALLTRNYNKDMQMIVDTAKMVREDIFSHNIPRLDGKFEARCQHDAIPSSLMSLVSMIVHGTSLKIRKEGSLKYHFP